MKQDHFTVGIPAYTTFRGGGLWHFLLQAIPALSQARPGWVFEVVGSITLPELQSLNSSNVHVNLWDNDPRTQFLYQWGSRVLKWLGKGGDAGFLLQKRAEMYGVPWGQARNRTAPFQQVDAVWVPHYNLSLERLALDCDLASTRVPVLLTIHDIHPAFYPEDHPTEDLARFYNGFVPFAQTCQHIYTHSQFQKSAIANHLQMPLDKISVTPQPPLIDPQKLISAYDPADASQTLSRCGINRRYVLYPASTAHIHKNHTRLLSAWLQLKQELGEVCPLLVFTGKGNSQQFHHLQNLVAALRLQDDVCFTGPVDTPVLATLYRNCELVVIPTLYEGAGSGILTDALVTGKPVACADIPQVHEQLAALGPVSITTFDPCNIFAIANAVKIILNDLEEQKQIAQQNQVIAQIGFAEMWQVWAEDYARCIENMSSA